MPNSSTGRKWLKRKIYQHKPLKTTDMKIIHIVVLEASNEGDPCTLICGAFHNLNDAKAEINIVRDKLYDEWKDETIDEDSETIFSAHREGNWLDYHIALYIVPTELK